MAEPSAEIDAVANAVIGAALEVHRHLGPGFIEGIYESALAAEFDMRRVAYDRQKPVSVLYKSQSVGDQRIDFLVEERLIVELKAVEKLLPIHQAQLMSYLKAIRLPLGLLINFNQKWLKDGIQRIVLS